jgi:hypothetical protein
VRRIAGCVFAGCRVPGFFFPSSGHRSRDRAAHDVAEQGDTGQKIAPIQSSRRRVFDNVDRARGRRALPQTFAAMLVGDTAIPVTPRRLKGTAHAGRTADGGR